jgi:uncharacterized protein YdhG (YjbR/CyaY superfamily)
MRKIRKTSPAVDAYISKQTTDVRNALEELRAAIWEAAPALTELMNYEIPAFALVAGGKRDHQVMIAGYAKHVGFYPSPPVVSAFAERLTQYKSAKGSVQFPLDKPIPKELVVQMVKFRLSQLQS